MRAERLVFSLQRQLEQFGGIHQPQWPSQQQTAGGAMQAPAKAMPMDNSIVYLGEVSSDGFRLLSYASAAPAAALDPQVHTHPASYAPVHMSPCCRHVCLMSRSATREPQCLRSP